MIASIILETHECPICGILHAIPESLVRQAKEQRGKKNIYCPAGHSWIFTGESDLEKERRARQRAEQETERLAQERNEETARRVRAERELTRHKKRATAGVCPCCTRTFSNMTRHMKTKHPNYNVVPLKAERA